MTQTSLCCLIMGLFLQRCGIANSFGQSVVVHESSSSAASNPAVSFPIFNQCIIEQDVSGVEIPAVAIEKNFKPLRPQLFHRTYGLETDFGKELYIKRIKPILEKALVGCTSVVMNCLILTLTFSDRSILKVVNALVQSLPS